MKVIDALTLDDFRHHPVWTWYIIENEFLVVPGIDKNPIDTNSYLHLFVFCNFILNDKTVVEGNICINLQEDNEWRRILFFTGDEKFVFWGNILPGQGSLTPICNWLQKTEDEINPISYNTPYYLSNGTKIQGEIDLKNW